MILLTSISQQTATLDDGSTLEVPLALTLTDHGTTWHLKHDRMCRLDKCSRRREFALSKPTTMAALVSAINCLLISGWCDEGKPETDRPTLLSPLTGEVVP